MAAIREGKAYPENLFHIGEKEREKFSVLLKISYNCVLNTH